MTHLTDDDLILHFYGEAPTAAAEVDAHLAACDSCRENWDGLRRTLEMVDSAEVPEAPAGFEQVLWARVREHLPEPRAARTPWWSPRLWAPLAGLAAVIAIAFVSGHLWSRAGTPASGGAAAPASADAAHALRESVLLSALGDHFEQTEQLLVEIKNAPDTKTVDVSFEQATARDLVAAGRLYRATARQNGDAQLAAVLDDLELVLVDIASSPDQLGTQDLTSLRARIEDDNLLFKLRALTTAVREREKTLSTPSKRTL